jgi:ribonuclease-3
MGSPTYSTRGTGPKHEQVFTSEVSAGGRLLGTGSASTKREAERIAAEAALEQLDAEETADRKKAKAPARSMTRKQPAAKTKGGRGARTAAPAPAEAAPPQELPDLEEQEDYADLPFEGPWPIFESVLSRSLQVAQKRVPSGLEGEDARIAIRDFTLGLYKELLQDLGEVVELDDEDETQQ